MTDFRQAARSLAANRTLVIAGIGTLVLGIGLTTTVFSVLQAVLLRALPYRSPERLVILSTEDPERGSGVEYKVYEQWWANARSFDAMAVYYRDTGVSRIHLTGTSEPQTGQGGFVSAGFFPLLGVPPVLGRTFNEEEVRLRERVAVISHRLWMRRFGGDASAIGRTLEIDRTPFTVIGVMPAEFSFPQPDFLLWAPISTNRFWRDDQYTPRRVDWSVVARLKTGVRPEQAAAELTTLAGADVRADRFRPAVRGDIRLSLWVLFAAACAVLLVCCVNVANLMLARTVMREREFALRAAMGASGWRLAREAMAESALIACLSGVLGALLAMFGVDLLVTLGPANVPGLAEARVNAPVLLFSLAVVTAVTALVGIGPAWRTSRADPQDALRAGGRGLTEGRGAGILRDGLVAAQFAVALLLLAATGLLLRSLWAVQNVDLGFDPARGIRIRAVLPWASAQESTDYFRRASERLRAMPGVRAVGGIDDLFILRQPGNLGLRAIDGRPAEMRAQWMPLAWDTVAGSYFEAMGVPLLRGRFFSQTDREGSPLVVVVDEEVARRYFPGEDPVGKRIKGQDERGRGDEWLTIIGVVSGTRRHGLERGFVGHIYEWYLQSGSAPRDLIIGVSGEPESMLAGLRQALRTVDRNAVISSVTTLSEDVAEQLAPRLFYTRLLTFFGVASVLLAAIGIAGVMYFSVARRRKEVGIRIALGADRSRIAGAVVRRSLLLAAVGAGVGIAAVWWAGSVIGRLLYGVTPWDGPTYLMVVGVLLLAAAVANLPAVYQAARVDPMTALREE